MRIKLYILFFVLLLAPVVKGQVVKFEKIFGGNGYDFGYDVIQTFDKGYAVVGSTSSFGAGSTDGYLLKTDSLGNFQWQQTFGYINVDHFYSIQETADSGLLMAGYTNNFGAGGYDVYVVKTDKNGNYLWAKTYGGTNWDFGYSISTTNDGGFVLTGGTYSYGSGDEDVFLVRANSNGDTLWTKAYGGLGQDEGKSVSQTTDGGFILTGYTKSFGDVSGDTYTIKTDGNGDTLWTKLYNYGGEDYLNKIIQTTDGGYIASGLSANITSGINEGLIIKMNSLGDTIFTRRYGSPNDASSYGICEVASGGYVWSGKLKIGSNYNVYFYKIDASGNWIYAYTLGGILGDDSGYSVKQTSDGGFVSVGYSKSFNNGLGDVYLFKTDSNGISSGSIVNEVDTYIQESRLKKTNLEIYPNPSFGNTITVRIGMDNAMSVKYSKIILYNSIGEIVYNEELVPEILPTHIQFLINTGNFDSGLYFAYIYIDETVFSGKLVIKR